MLKLKTDCSADRIVKDDILPYYQMADVFVAPFRLARGVQNKVLQAFSCALPVVATPTGAEGINCAGGEHICLATDAREFIDSVIYLLENIYSKAPNIVLSDSSILYNIWQY